MSNSDNKDQSGPGPGDVQSRASRGVVKWFDAQKGYGFVIPYGEAKEVFFHAETLRLSSLGEVASGLAICVVIENDGPKAAVK